MHVTIQNTAIQQTHVMCAECHQRRQPTRVYHTVGLQELMAMWIVLGQISKLLFKHWHTMKTGRAETCTAFNQCAFWRLQVCKLIPITVKHTSQFAMSLVHMELLNTVIYRLLLGANCTSAIMLHTQPTVKLSNLTYIIRRCAFHAYHVPDIEH